MSAAIAGPHSTPTSRLAARPPDMFCLTTAFLGCRHIRLSVFILPSNWLVPETKNPEFLLNKKRDL
jgi:hypothetical protein